MTSSHPCRLLVSSQKCGWECCYHADLRWEEQDLRTV
eukprot:symbB.v1.2.037770.t1/scaffold5660.1/size24809/1